MKNFQFSKIFMGIMLVGSSSTVFSMQYAEMLKNTVLTKEAGKIALAAAAFVGASKLVTKVLVESDDWINFYKQRTDLWGRLMSKKIDILGESFIDTLCYGLPAGIGCALAARCCSWSQQVELTSLIKPTAIVVGLISIPALKNAFAYCADAKRRKEKTSKLRMVATFAGSFSKWLPYSLVGGALVYRGINEYRVN